MPLGDKGLGTPSKCRTLSGPVSLAGSLDQDPHARVGWGSGFQSCLRKAMLWSTGLGPIPQRRPEGQ